MSMHHSAKCQALPNAVDFLWSCEGLWRGLSFQCTPSYSSLSITQKKNSRLQYRNSGFNLDKAVGQSYEYIHTGTYNNDKLKHHDANIHNT